MLDTTSLWDHLDLLEFAVDCCGEKKLYDPSHRLTIAVRNSQVSGYKKREAQ